MVRRGLHLRHKSFFLFDVTMTNKYSRLPITRTSKGNRKTFELSGVKLVRKLPGGESKKVRVIEGLSYRDSTSSDRDLDMKYYILPPIHIWTDITVINLGALASQTTVPFIRMGNQMVTSEIRK